MVLLLIQGLILMGLVSFNQAVDVVCDGEDATFTINPTDIADLGLVAGDSWYVDSPSTNSPTATAGCMEPVTTTTMTIPISTCGCEVEAVLNDINCISISWHIRKSSSQAYHRDNACLLVRCVYKLDFDLTLGITQTLNKYTSTATSDQVELDVCIETYGSQANLDAGSPTQAAFIVPAKVYAKIRIKNADPKFSIHIDDCCITPAGAASPKYSIVSNGVVDTGFDLSNSYTGGIADLEATFCFESFAWVNPALTTYVIQCTGVCCIQDATTGDCGPNPFTVASGRRRRRSTFDEMYFEAVSRPLWFINQQKN